MQELTLTIDYCDYFSKELEEYLISLKGVIKSKINLANNEINIKYDSKLININILKNEILLFLSLNKIPSIISFDKHSINKTINYNIIIKDLCCEYCLKHMIEELLLIDGINSAYSNFNYKNKTNVNLIINYDNNLITKEEIIAISHKFNNSNTE